MTLKLIIQGHPFAETTINGMLWPKGQRSVQIAGVPLHKLKFQDKLFAKFQDNFRTLFCQQNDKNTAKAGFTLPVNLKFTNLCIIFNY